MDKLEVAPEEILEVYRYGQKQGFAAGVILCFAAKYLWNRRVRYQEALAAARRNEIR